MIVHATREDYASLLNGRGPRHYRLTGTPIAPPDILVMLASLSARIEQGFTPGSWLMVERDEVVGLCSIKRPPENGVVEIGYGVAPACQNRGMATRAVRDIIDWAEHQEGIAAIVAETLPDNLASHKVLSRNRFVRTGERIDEEDGRVICWRRNLR